jgi:cytochrome c
MRYFYHASCKALLITACIFSVPSYANKALAGKNGCLACHATNEKLVGPAYKDVAQKYEGVVGAKETLIQHILEGGVGRWGDMPMPPQKQLSSKQAAILAEWILKGAN